jgi:hypothetical protein
MTMALRVGSESAAKTRSKDSCWLVI